MASDLQWPLVKRLREGRTNGSEHRWAVTDTHLEAADRIEALEEQLRLANFDALNAEAEAERLRSAATTYVARAGGLQPGDRWTTKNTHDLRDLLTALNEEAQDE